MRVAIVGCGQIARMHVGVLKDLEGIELVGVCDRDAQRANEAATWVPGVPAYTDFATMLAEQRPAAIHVLTPPATHASVAVQALAAGCHVFVEKPMALAVGDTERMIAAAQAAGVRLATNHNYRFKPAIQRALALAQGGALGRIIHMNGYYGISANADELMGVGGNHWAFRLPGGVFTDFLPHLIYLQQLFLPATTEVAGVAIGRDAEGLETELGVLVRGGGATANMTISLRARPYAKFVEIYGTRGTLRADLVREICTHHRTWRVPNMIGRVLYSLEEAAQLITGSVANTLAVATGRMARMPELAPSIASFYEAIRQGREPENSGEAGRRMVAFLEQIWAQAPDLTTPAQLQERKTNAGPQTAIERELVRSGRAPRRAVVTGATGYLGRHLVEALARCGTTLTVVVRDRGRLGQELERLATVVECEITDTAALAKAMCDADAVFHCAAVTRNNVSWEVHREVNIDGARAVFEAAGRAGCKRVVHVSSIVVYGFDRRSGAIRESDSYGSGGDRWAHYLRSKRESDRLALSLARAENFPVVVVRPGVIYGPGGNRSVGRGLAQVGPVRLTIGDGRNTLPFTYVDNLVDALLLAATVSGIEGRAYNIVDATDVTIRECIDEGAAATGERVTLLPVPAKLLAGVAGVLEGRRGRAGADSPPRLSRFVVRSTAADLRYDTRRAHAELGWSPAVEWREGLRRVAEDS